MRKYNIRGYNVSLGFDKKDKILYIKPNESNKVIALFINTGNMASGNAFDIKFSISNINPNLIQPRKLQYLLSAAGIKKRDIISIISAYNNPLINNKFNTYKMSKCIMYYRMRMLEMFLKFTTRYKLSLLSRETILLMGFTRCEKYVYTHLGMMRGACYFRFTDNLNKPQTYILGKTSVFVFNGSNFIKEQARVLIPVGFNHKIIDNNHIIILDRTYTTNSGYVLPVTVLKLKDTLDAELDASDKEDIKNGVDRLYNIKYKNDIFII
jgi:hypothetical protein